MKYKYLLLLFLFLYQLSFSQKDSAFVNNKKAHLSTIVQGGIVEGEKGTSLQLQLVSGFNFNTWQVGVGTGLDYYYLRSIPLFLDVRKYLSNPKIPLFAFADAGINFPWVKEEPETWQLPNTYDNGFYYDLGVGYKFASKRHTGLLISAGYSEKKMTVVNKIVNPCLYPPCPEYSNNYHFELRRISLKAGLRF